jgi:hypothetical protein
MRRAVAIIAFGLVVASAAAAAPRVRSFAATSTVTSLAADGSLTAFAVAPRGRDCYHVDVWNRSSRAVFRLGAARACPPATSTGNGLVGPVMAGSRALWLTYVGGNIREWSLWTATTTARTPRRIRFIARDVDAAPPIVLGQGDSSKLGFLLPFTVDDTLYGLRANGTSVSLLQAPSRIVAVAAKDGEVAAALESGAVEIVDGAGHLLRTEAFSGPVSAVAVTGDALVAQQGRVLALRNGVTDHNWTLPAGARLADADGSIAVYVRGKELHVFDLETGVDALFRTTATLPVAQLEPGGLVYAAGRSVTFVPLSELLSRLGAA